MGHHPNTDVSLRTAASSKYSFDSPPGRSRLSCLWKARLCGAVRGGAGRRGARAAPWRGSSRAEAAGDGGRREAAHGEQRGPRDHKRAHIHTYGNEKTKNPNTFPSHADFEAFFEAAVLTLIAVVLVDRTIPVGAARVGEVPSYAPLEEALAALASELAVVFAAGFVPAHHALDVLRLLLRLLRRLVRRRGLRVVRGPLDRGLGGRRGHLRGGQVQLAWLRGGKR